MPADRRPAPMFEHEVKLSYPDAEAARHAITIAGARLVVSRRLIQDQLYDRPTFDLGRSGSTLRIRRDGDRGFLAFKGPRIPGAVKTREELETVVHSANTVEVIVNRLGYSVVFRSEKFREEYELDDAHVVVDETPMGVFVEIEAQPDAIDRAAVRLGRSTSDYVTESYPSLWRKYCAARGLGERDMTFDATDPAASRRLGQGTS